MSRPVRLLAVDFGDARTGLAATDWTGTICVPLPRIDSKQMDEVVRAVAELARERESQAIAVGMPLSVDGKTNARSQRTETFRLALAAAAPCPVHAIDESHTTDEAHERLRDMGLRASQRRKVADSVAALVILERFRAQLRSQK